ncbi:hypothetical protein NEOLEDRAFT_1127876 [Neolentinus lepideus HHB14362 ss-1]|uniref:Nucleoporin Nup159/Nup146 N-terminal domain-containing protein n=1 Tax=Neolentinus lepideus HHB14362 ss-1 TaxID=1314782 RepID=A0A165VP17_9AGAM|nr:hypothetical protein NEOLEDRAFT_1127876 [Neolentinus lepideus HHB14362 ss-1]
MNVWPIRPQPKLEATALVKDSSEKDASNFLSFRLLNKRARVRISPEGHDLKPLPGKAQFLVVANSKGWFAAVVRTSSGEHLIVVSPLLDLRAAFASSDYYDDNEINLNPKRTVSLSSANPDFLVLAANDSRLLVSILNGPILIFDTTQLFKEGSEQVTPMHQFAPTVPTPVRQIVANPGDIPELVAILREPDGKSESQLVDILDVVKLQSVGGWKWLGTPETTPTALSWSPKGKQIAVGLENGDILTFSPTATVQVKSKIPKAPTSRHQSVLSVTWLTNPAFHVVYAPPGARLPIDAEQSHFIVSMDTKSNTVTTTKLATPCYPFPGNRPPSTFMHVLRNWEPIKFLMVMGDSGSSDIALIACVPDSSSPTQESWHNMSMDETGTASMPLDQDLNETVMIGLEIDFTNTDAFHSTSPGGEAFEVPPPPIVYAYCNDGTIQAWFLVNAGAPSYPGMVSPGSVSSVPSIPSISAPALATRDISITMDSVTQPSTPTVTGFGQTSQPQSAFGQSSAQPAFGQTSAFGAFASNTPSAFGQSSTFGQSSVSPRSDPGQAKFGQAGFGFASESSATPSAPAIESTPSADMSMLSEADDALGSMSLGDLNSTPKSEEKKPSIFRSTSSSGIFGQSSTNNQSSAFPSGGAFGLLKASDVGFGASSQGTSSFLSAQSSSSSDAIKPASGFGAFSNFKSQQSTPTPASSETPKPSSAFGSSGFGTKPASTFGQSGFGQPSTFGKAPATPASSSVFSSSNSGGGFAAFAGSGTGSFSSALQQSGSTSGGGFETAKTDTPSTTTSMFGNGGSAVSAPTSVFGQTGTTSSSVFDNSSTNHSTTPVQSQGKPAAPTVKPVLASPPSSPPLQTKEVAPPSTPGPTGGVFGQLKTTSSSFIKPGQGFGMSVSSDSPFMRPKKPVEVFAALSQPATTTPSTSERPSSAFGTPSPLGAAKSVFGQSSFGSSTTLAEAPKLAAPAIPSAASTGAFSAFSGNSVGFGAFAGATKPFSALLREGKEDSPVPKSVSVFATPQKSIPKASNPSPDISPTETSQGSSSGLRTPRASGDDGDSDDGRGESSSSERFSEEALGNQEPLKLSDLTKEPSFGSLSLSSTSRDSSFVDVAHASEDDDNGAPKSPASEHTDNAEDDTVSFLSEEFGEGEGEEVPSEGSAEDEGEGAQEEEEEEEEEEGNDPIPRTSTPVLPSTPKPASRSPSTTPKAEAPMLKPSPAASSPAILPEDKIPSLFKGTTPTTSLARDVPSQPALAAPAPVTPSTPSTAFSLGIGKPSTRPARSSPLARPPTTPDQADNAPKIPMPLFGTKPSPSQSPTPQTPQPASEAQGSRPKTPPLLSILGTPAPASTVPESFASANPSQVSLAPGLLNLPPGPLFPPPSPSAKPVTPAAGGLLGTGKPTSLFPGPATPAKPVAKAPTIEEGMQGEVARLFYVLAKELEELRKYSETAKLETASLKAPSSTKPGAVVIGDIGRLSEKLQATEAEVAELKTRKKTYTQAIRELEGGLMKATTKREEIVRFSKASKDPEFAKALRIRSLGPEYTETQRQLRRNITVVRDRVETLEEHIKSAKKRVREYKTGQPALRPSSLETIHKAYDNIDVALDQQTKDIDGIAKRLAQLDKKRQARLLPSDVSRQREVTPDVAVTTAATLNAERSAQKLKRALLAARKEPLLNKQALDVMAPTVQSLTGPIKKEEPRPGTSFLAIDPAPVIPAPPKVDPGFFDFGPLPPIKSEPINLPEFTLPPLEVSSDGSPAHGGRQRSNKYHMKSVQLKKSPSPAKVPSTSPPVAFDWGPLPGVKPKSSLSADVRPEKKSPSMEGSWVLDGFQNK